MSSVPSLEHMMITTRRMIRVSKDIEQTYGMSLSMKRRLPISKIKHTRVIKTQSSIRYIFVTALKQDSE